MDFKTFSSQDKGGLHRISDKNQICYKYKICMGLCFEKAWRLAEVKSFLAGLGARPVGFLNRPKRGARFIHAGYLFSANRGLAPGG